MSGQKYTSFLLKSLVSFLLFAGGYTSVFALPGFIVDGSNGANSTGPCTGKTVCHISGDLTYSDITLINGGKLSHRQGTLTVSNNFLLGGTGAGFFVGQNTIVGNLLKIQGDSVFALNSNLTSDPASNNISDWMGATYYDLQVSNTNLSFTGMDVSLSTSCTTAGGGSTLSACIQTRNVNVNSKLSATASATNVVWKTYANGYLAVDGDATLTNIKMDVAGYLFVQGNVFGSFNNAHYIYVTGGQQVSTPDAVGFTTAGVRVDGNMTLTGSASLPDFYMSGATGTAADNWYISGSLFVKQMSLGVTGKTNSNSLGYITAKNGSITITDADTLYFNWNIYSKGDLVLTNNATVDGNDLACNNGNASITTGTTHTYGAINVSNGTLSLSGITTLNRNGNISASSHITFTNITTSNGASTSVTSNNGNISVTTGTTHTYGDIVATGGGFSISGVTTLNRSGNITVKNDISLTNITTSSGAATNITSTNGNASITTGTTHTYKDITVFGNLSLSGITTSLDTRIITNSGATTLTNVLLHNRTGNITTVGDILFNNVTTSSGATTNVTSTTGNITVTTGTTHTYNYLNAYKDNSVTSIASYNANNISTNGGFIMTGSTLNITDMTDSADETKQNIDISTGSGFIITNSTANLQNSSIQTNGYLEVNNTDWKSQNLNINGYTTLSAEKVGVYFRWGKDRTIFGTIFAGGGSIWVGTAATPDDGNIFLKRKAGVTTNGNIKVYRSNTTLVDSFSTAPDTVPTANTSLFTQLYDASLLSLSGSITVLTGSTTNKDYAIDGNTATFYESTTAGSAFRVDFPRDMIISKLCVVAGVNEPDNLKLQFMDASSTVINTQTQKMPTSGQPRTCFDLNSYKARKILVTGYGASTALGFGELEFWGVPADTANIAAPFGNDIVLQNGSYEFGGVLTSGNLNASSTSGKKIRAIQYHNNAPFNHKNSIALASASAGGTTFTHSVGNEAGLRFITDTMNIGANVTVDVVGKGYLGGNSNNEFYTSTGWVGNITPGALRIAAGDGGMGGGIGGYGVSGGGGGGGMLGVKNSGVWGNTTQKFFTGSKGGGYTYTQCIIDSPYGQEGRLRCTGYNGYGNIGNNSTSGVSSFTEVTATSLSGGVNKGWSYVSNGYYSTCGIKDGSVYCWGYRGYSIMADGNPTATNQLIPLQIGTTGDLAANGGNVGFSKVFVGPSGDNDPTCALKTNGDLYCWGENSNYQIDNSGTDILYPKLVGTGIKDFGIHYRRIAIIDSTGRVWQRGQNMQYNIGNTGYTNSNNYHGNTTVYMCANSQDSYCGTPAWVSYGSWIKKVDGYGEAGGETGFEKVFLNSYSACAIKAWAGYCWGYNHTSYGNMGVNDSSYAYHGYFRAIRPQNNLSYNNNITEMWPSNNQAYVNADGWCMLRLGGLYCWGYAGNNNGAYGGNQYYYPQYYNGDLSGYNYSPSNYRNGNYSEIVPGYSGMCAIWNNGYLYCWGVWTGYYWWGSGDSSSRNYPYQQGSALAMPISNTGYDPSTKYPAFDAHGGWKSASYTNIQCIIDASTKLWCAGYLQGYWIWDGVNTSTTTFVEVAATNLPNGKNEGWTQVTTSSANVCGINRGKVYCWGYWYSTGQWWNTTLTIPTAISEAGGSLPSYGGNADFGKVLLGSYTTSNNFACAMKTSGTYKGFLFCWGQSSDYQISTSATQYYYAQIVPSSPLSGTNVWKDFSVGNRSLHAIDELWNVFGRGYNYYGNIDPQSTSSYDGQNSYYLYNNVYGWNPCWSNFWCVKRDIWHHTGDQNSYVKMDRIYAQYQTVCGIKNGSVYCWGYSGTNNTWNTSRWTNQTYYPIHLTNVQSLASTNTFENNNISDLISNGNTTDNWWCAIRLGKVYCWGYGNYYQNGKNTTWNFDEPYDITSNVLPNGQNGSFAGLSDGGGYSACGIHTSGALYCWGYQWAGSYYSWWDASSTNMNSMYSYNSSYGYVPTLRAWLALGTTQIGFPGSGPGSGGGNLGYGGYGGSATCTGSLGNNSLGNTKGGNGGWALGGSGSNWHGGGGQVGPCSGGGGGTGGNSDSNPYRLGSGGGAGGLAQNDYSKGYGGNGGGMIRISTNTLVLSGSLLATGNVGKDASVISNAPTVGAGAGGAGGSILIRAKSLTCATGNAIDVKGGQGGAGASSVAGGGGGGGWVITYYYTNKTGTCNGAVLAGTGGTNGWATGGQDGKVYESVGTTFDTLKSRVTIENSPAAADGVQAVTVRAYFLDVNGVPLEGEYLVAEVVGDLWTGKINGGSPLPQTDANGMLSFPITSTVKGIKKIILKNALTYTELQEQPTLTFGIPQVSIAKVADKSTVNSGDVVTYTITLTNSGSGDAGGDPENAIVIEDVLPTGFTYWTTGPTAGSKWDTGSGTTQYYIFPEVTGDGTAGNEQRLRYTVTDGLSGPANIPSGGWKVRLLFDVKAP